ncbi:uncharacterized protein LOC107868084 isoform X3 [Capsicum annuum]|uniref:uncharacterized protein LOC107868084 isoform X3 n=1 Tax=Capsicum annuum TaxID=4072 RepID=UPI0007BF00D3|nr:uncharacterized protein LOC107868084 isoform X3 [Capsicum annuum]
MLVQGYETRLNVLDVQAMLYNGFSKIYMMRCVLFGILLNIRHSVIKIKKPRSSLKGGSLHTVGIKSVGAIVREMEKDLGRKPTQLEVFKQTYVKKNMNESDPDVWVETRAENVNNEYVRYLSEFGSTEPTQEESIKIWTEKVAGGKKGENLCVWFSK